MKYCLITAFLFLTTYLSFAQDQTPTLQANFGKGIGVSSGDKLFTMNISGRIQSMAEFRRDLVNDISTTDFLLRRCRLNIQGTALNPKFTYRIQLGFAHGDITTNNSAVVNNLFLRDAMLYYAPKKWLKIGFGQTKLPGNRQRLVSSANLQLVERSIANNNFTLDRDKGIWVITNFKLKNVLLKGTVAVSSGEGRIVSDKNGKLCYSGRFECLPLGEFTNGGDIMESDQEMEKKPKLSIAGVYSYNDQTSRAMGQLGEYLYNGKTSNIRYYGADLFFKYMGFSFETEWYNRQSSTGIIINSKDSTLKNYVMSGSTLMFQAGYLVTPSNEVAVRFATITPDEAINAVAHDQKEFVVGYSHYFKKHHLKIQTDGSYFENGSNKSFVYRLSSVVTF